MSELNEKDLEVIFDVLNVFDPNDISHVYPEMGEEQFGKDVNDTWKKVLDMLRPNGLYKHNQLTFDYSVDQKSSPSDVLAGKK